MPESLVVCFIDREIRNSPPVVGSRDKNYVFSETGEQCSTLRITPYLSEANQVYSLSRLIDSLSTLRARKSLGYHCH